MSFVSMAQDWNWGSKPNVTKGEWMFLDHCIITEEYEEAIRPLNNLLMLCPDLSKALYIKGNKVYKNLIKSETDPVKKQAYQDSSLVLFDKRLEIYKDSAEVYNRKCLVLWSYSYKKSDNDQILEMKKYYEKCFELNGEKTFGKNYCNYFLLSAKLMKEGFMTQKEFYKTYNLCLEKTDEKYHKTINKYYNLYLKMDKKFVEENLYAEFLENKTVEQAEALYPLVFKYGCEDSVKLGIFIYMHDELKDYKSTYRLAEYYYDFDIRKSLETMKECEQMDLAQEDMDHVYLYISGCYFNLGQLSLARSYALKSVKTYYKDAHRLIGNLYYNSFDQYTGYERRLVFIAAYEEYEKSGDTKMMAVCKEQFPSMEDIFVRSGEIGGTEHLGGWINTDVHLRKR